MLLKAFYFILHTPYTVDSLNFTFKLYLKCILYIKFYDFEPLSPGKNVPLLHFEEVNFHNFCLQLKPETCKALL